MIATARSGAFDPDNAGHIRFQKSDDHNYAQARQCHRVVMRGRDGTLQNDTDMRYHLNDHC